MRNEYEGALVGRTITLNQRKQPGRLELQKSKIVDERTKAAAADYHQGRLKNLQRRLY